MSMDYDGSFAHWERRLEAEGVDPSILGNYCGCTYGEIDGVVNRICKAARAKREKEAEDGTVENVG